MPSTSIRRTTALATLLILSLCSCGVDPAQAPPGPLNIVLFTVDTLRADHLSCYGYRRETSPAIGALADEGILFERAYTVMGTTLPAHLSIMTGLYPHQHGYVANHGAMHGKFNSSDGRRAIAEYLRKAGYHTAAFVSGPTVAGGGTGLDSGFDLYNDHVCPDPQTLEDTSRRSGDTNEKVLAWLAKKPPEPFFLWVHYWDPHEPNIPLEPFASAFESDEELDSLIEERRIRPEVLRERFSDLELVRLFAPELFPPLQRGESIEMPPIDHDAVRRLINLYDGDVLAIDTAFGHVLEALTERGLLERSIVTFTADHGQALGQHDWLEHGRIQGENLHVPLVMRFPEWVVPQPSRVADPVSVVDIFPTILARLDEKIGAAFLEQSSGEDCLDKAYIRRFAFSQRSVRERDWEPEGGDDGRKFALTTREWKYYHRPDSQDELYDLLEDPGELADVAADHPEVVSALRRHVLSILAERLYVPAGLAGADSEEAKNYLKMLRQLGYVGEKNE
jgi:arylsulfatase A-like enzyme